MRKPLTLLVASTALSAAMGFPVWSATPNASSPGYAAQGFTASGGAPALAMPGAAAEAGLLVLASGDDEGDDDDDDDEDDDDCDDDDESCGRRLPNPAPAGTVAPPANGLFLNGTPPQVKVN